MKETMTFRDSVRANGYAVVDDVLTESEVKDLQTAIAAVPESKAVRRRRGVYGIRNLLGICPSARNVAISDKIWPFVINILGQDCFAVRGIFFDKVPGANWNLSWHQDSVIAVNKKMETDGFEAWSTKAGVVQVQPPAEVLAQMLAIRIHLDPCGIENGPLRVLPGSHDHGWLDEEIVQWKEKTPEVACIVGLGGIVAMRPLILHASSPADSPDHRRVIHIEYASCELPGTLDWRLRLRPSDRDPS